MSWLPWTISTSGNGPGPSGYHTRPLSGSESNPKPQYFFRCFVSAGVGPVANLVAFTVPVLSVTESRNSGRRLSFPLP